MSQHAAVRDFFDYAQERHRIFLDKSAGKVGPHTADTVLQQFRFCNIFREDDKTTKWFAQHVRDKVSEKAYCLEAVAGFRWFNRIEVGERIAGTLVAQGWNSGMIKEQVAGMQPLITGAYMIKTPTGMNKLDGICWCMDQLVAMRLEVVDLSLQDAWIEIKRAPFLGSFMAYEIVTDLRHTRLLCNAEDIDTWTVAGPGAARGLGWILRNDPSHFSYTSKAHQEEMLNTMRMLLDFANGGKHWPLEWGLWEMREVEHTLCEYDKWRRGHEGQKLKRRYQCT